MCKKLAADNAVFTPRPLPASHTHIQDTQYIVFCSHCTRSTTDFAFAMKNLYFPPIVHQNTHRHNICAISSFIECQRAQGTHPSKFRTEQNQPQNTTGFFIVVLIVIFIPADTRVVLNTHHAIVTTSHRAGRFGGHGPVFTCIAAACVVVTRISSRGCTGVVVWREEHHACVRASPSTCHTAHCAS